MTPGIPFIFAFLQQALPPGERPREDRPPISNAGAVILMLLVGIAAFAWSAAGGVLR